jgi:hypothetical protein
MGPSVGPDGRKEDQSHLLAESAERMHRGPPCYRRCAKDSEVGLVHGLVPPVERLLPREESVVDLQRAGADLNGAVHPSGRDPDIAVSEASIQAEGGLVVKADTKAESIASACVHFTLGRHSQGGRDTPP